MQSEQCAGPQGPGYPRHIQVEAATKQMPELPQSLFFKIRDGCEARLRIRPDGILLYVEASIRRRNEADALILKKSYSSCLVAALSRFSLRFSIMVFCGFFLGSLGCLLFSAMVSSLRLVLGTDPGPTFLLIV